MSHLPMDGRMFWQNGSQSKVCRHSEILHGGSVFIWICFCLERRAQLLLGEAKNSIRGSKKSESSLLSFLLPPSTSSFFYHSACRECWTVLRSSRKIFPVSDKRRQPSAPPLPFPWPLKIRRSNKLALSVTSPLSLSCCAREETSVLSRLQSFYGWTASALILLLARTRYF